MGLSSVDEALGYVLNFIQKHQEPILKHGLGKNPTATFILGRNKLVLGNDGVRNFEKPSKKKK